MRLNNYGLKHGVADFNLSCFTHSWSPSQYCTYWRSIFDEASGTTPSTKKAEMKFCCLQTRPSWLHLHILPIMVKTYLCQYKPGSCFGCTVNRQPFTKGLRLHTPRSPCGLVDRTLVRVELIQHSSGRVTTTTFLLNLRFNDWLTFLLQYIDRLSLGAYEVWLSKIGTLSLVLLLNRGTTFTTDQTRGTVPSLHTKLQRCVIQHQPTTSRDLKMDLILT